MRFPWSRTPPAPDTPRPVRVAPLVALLALLAVLAGSVAACERVDTGSIDLGRRLDAKRVEVEERTAVFRAGEPFAFALFLTGAPGPTDLDLVLLRDAAGPGAATAAGHEVVWQRTVVITVRDFRRSRAGLELPDLTRDLAPGAYRLQVRRGELVIAEGRFSVVSP